MDVYYERIPKFTYNILYISPIIPGVLYPYLMQHLNCYIEHRSGFLDFIVGYWKRCGKMFSFKFPSEKHHCISRSDLCVEVMSKPNIYQNKGKYIKQVDMFFTPNRFRTNMNIIRSISEEMSTIEGKDIDIIDAYLFSLQHEIMILSCSLFNKNDGRDFLFHSVNSILSNANMLYHNNDREIHPNKKRNFLFPYNGYYETRINDRMRKFPNYSFLSLITFFSRITANTSMWCLYEISRHPEIQERIYHDENYIDKVIRETLRLYPSLPFIFRTSTEDTILGGKTICKYDKIIISPLLMGLDSSRWEEPFKYNPNRDFSKERLILIDKHYSLMSIKVMIKELVSKYYLQLVTDNVKVEYNKMLMPSVPIKIRLTRRE